MIVVDDRLLFDLLAGTEPTDLLEAATGGAATTFSWYCRLSRAIATGRIEGALSRHYAGLAEDRRARVRSLLDDLSDRVEIVGTKELVPSRSVTDRFSRSVRNPVRSGRGRAALRQRPLGGQLRWAG